MPTVNDLSKRNGGERVTYIVRHVYRTYTSTVSGALYCGGVTMCFTYLCTIYTLRRRQNLALSLCKERKEAGVKQT